MKIGILIFDQVEILDAMGPFEVFGVASSETLQCDPSGKDWQVCLISNSKNAKPSSDGSHQPINVVTCRNGLKVIADHHVNDEEIVLDILVVPGGAGSRSAMKDPDTLQFVHRHYHHPRHPVKSLLSVCTGALIVVEALKSGPKPNDASEDDTIVRVTTHHTCFDFLRQIVEDANRARGIEKWNVVTNQRVVANHDSRLVFAGGITAGIDMSLYMVDKLLGREQAMLVAKEMEYHAPFLERNGPLLDSDIGGDCWPKPAASV